MTVPLSASTDAAGGRGPTHRGRVRLLLLVPVALALALPLYNGSEPALAGVPFFYWVQMALIVVAAVCMATVYRVVDAKGVRR